MSFFREVKAIRCKVAHINCTVVGHKRGFRVSEEWLNYHGEVIPSIIPEIK